ncbi:MAG TPA: type II secretion system protein GspN [Kofleriaceae bacterium]|jgi:type II secretion system protein N|nr:type II secretion system protein GspN [Kofleriaceae bacterium]
MAIVLTRRQRIILRYAGIVLATLVVFVFALQATFPYDRVRDKAIDALSSSYDVQIGSIDRGFMPGSVTFKAVTLTSRPAKAGDTPTVLFLDSVHVDLGVLALLGMTASIDLDVRIGVGRVKGNVSLGKFGRGTVKLDLDASSIPGRDLPLGSWGVPPIVGKLDAQVDLTIPVIKTKSGREIRDWTKADGNLAVSCPAGCTLGDGKTKLKPLLKNRSNQALVGDGIDFGKLSIDSLFIEAKFTPAVGEPESHSSAYKAGKFDVTKFELKSKDGELHVDYSMTLAPELDESIVTGCLRFNVTENLLKTEEGKKTFAAVSTSGAEKRSDGLFHIKLTDHLKDMKRLNLECGPNAKPGPEDHPGVMRPPSIRPTPEVAKPEPQRFEPPKPAEPAKPPEGVVPKTELKPSDTPKPEGSAEGSAPPAEGSAPAPETPPVQ